ncbi:hypothetical protein PvNV_035 [Penaeus vannamei nudivirus]|nr:hypothetical protein PvSNPV_035 [Penaeus vannamei nucleopolyhedrovirus]
MDIIIKDIIVSDTLTNDEMHIIQCNSKLIRGFGMYLIYDINTETYSFIDTTTRLDENQILVLDGIIKLNTESITHTFQTFKNVLEQKDRLIKYRSFRTCKNKKFKRR